VGDQFGASNSHFLPRVFSWFYFAINFGSSISTLLIPVVLHDYGAHYAFAIPGILMLLATFVFWMGRNKFVHIPPSGLEFVKESIKPESLRIIGRLAVLYVFIAMFWALFDQTSSSWVLQAEHMNRTFLGHEWLSSQFQAINPLLILILIPIFSYVIYPALDKVFPLTPLRKIGIGLFVAVPSFLIPAWVEMRIGHGEHPSIFWQFLAYLLITAAEVLISITGLEFSYTQAPKKMKSLIMGIFLCSTTVGDLFVSLVNIFIQNPDGSSKLPGAQYYLFFAGLMLGFAILYLIVSQFFTVRTIIQDETPDATPQPATGA
jgi:POT family proton-dependent oligopeptide transporter